MAASAGLVDLSKLEKTRKLKGTRVAKPSTNEKLFFRFGLIATKYALATHFLIDT